MPSPETAQEGRTAHSTSRERPRRGAREGSMETSVEAYSPAAKSVGAHYSIGNEYISQQSGGQSVGEYGPAVITVGNPARVAEDRDRGIHSRCNSSTEEV